MTAGEALMADVVVPFAAREPAGSAAEAVAGLHAQHYSAQIGRAHV